MAIINAVDDPSSSPLSFTAEEISVEASDPAEATAGEEGHANEDGKSSKDSATREDTTFEPAPVTGAAKLSVSYEAQKSSKRKVPVALGSREEIRVYKKRRLFGSFNEVITLIVGGEDEALKSFIVHQKVLCAASPFFESACKPDWMASEDRVLRLHDDDPVAIEMMLFWMYHNTIAGPHSLLCARDVLVTSDMNTGVGLFAKLFVLGEKYQMPGLRNDAVDAIYLWSEKGGQIPAKVIAYIWGNTLANSCIRALLVKLVKQEFSYTQLEKMRDEVGSDFWCSMTLDYCLDNEIRKDMMEYENVPYSFDHGYDECLWQEDFCPEFHTHESAKYPDHERKEYQVFRDDNDD